MELQLFPLSLTRIAKLPAAGIRALSREFLGQGWCAEAAAQPAPATAATCRLVIRLLTEAQLQWVRTTAGLVGDDHLAGCALLALLAETVRPRPSMLAGEDSAGLPARRLITIRAMARSFHRPYETMRRAGHRLMHLGLVETGQDGMVLRHDALQDARLRHALAQMHDIMVTLLDDLFGFAHLPLPAGAVTASGGERLDPACAGAIRLAALDLQLLAVEGLQGIISDWSGALLVAAIVAGNTRTVTYHPELAFAYAGANQVPPMHLRRPVSYKALCEALPICPTTTWRRIAVMKLLGSLLSIDGGLVIDGAWLRNPTMTANTCARIERMHGVVNRMAQTVPLDRIDLLYVAGRVPPVPL